MWRHSEDQNGSGFDGGKGFGELTMGNVGEQMSASVRPSYTENIIYCLQYSTYSGAYSWGLVVVNGMTSHIVQLCIV